MQGQYSILIDGNGNVTIRDASNGIVTIHTNNANEILDELRQLNPAQIDTLLQVAPQLKEQLSEQFSSNLNNVAREKNVVKGSISNVGTVRIGDEIQYHTHHPDIKLPKELTLSIPKTHPDDIIGREEDLIEVHGLLSNSKRVVVVNGLGGIGKTTLAQAYVSKYYDEYAHIAWITQSSDNIENDFINTAGLISNLQMQITNFKPEEIFGEIIRKLKAIEGKSNLLIIDNAEQSVQKYQHRLPGQPVWHVLLTSREEIEGFYAKPLGFLSEEQAITLFKKHYSRQKLHDQDIKDLVESVGYHTLAIEILAKTAQAQRYDAVTLKNAIESNVRANIVVVHNRQAAKIEKVGSYLSSIFSLSRLVEAEIWLLKQFTCLPSTFHSYDLLYELINDKENLYKDTFSETITGLAQSGWLLYINATDSYKMHHIIAKVVKKELNISNSDIRSLLETICQKLNVDQSKDNPVDKFVWIPFGTAILAGFAENTTNEIALLQYNLAVVLIELGDFQGAKQLLQKAVLSYKKNFGEAHISTVRSYSILAIVLQHLGHYKSAKTLLQKVVLSCEENFGTAHATTAISYSNLATVLQALGDYEEARVLLQKVVLFYEKNFGTMHPFTAIGYSNLATVLDDLGNYEESKELHQKAVLAAEKNFGIEHPSTAKRYSNLATVLTKLKDYDGAIASLQKALLSDVKNFGREHPLTAKRYSNLASVLQDLGNYEGAKGLLEKAVLSYEKNFGIGHPSTAISYSNLALVLQNLGEYKEALNLSGRALAIFKITLPEGHTHIETVTSIYQSIKSKMV